MAKESMKAREVKRAKLVAKYAAKRAALKKVIATAEDPMDAYEAARSPGHPCKRKSYPSSQPLQNHWTSKRFHASVWTLSYPVPRDGICWSDPRCEEGKLVNCGYRRADLVNKNLTVTSSGVT